MVENTGEGESAKEVNADLFQPAYTVNAYKKKAIAVEELVSSATEDEVRSFLVAVLAEDEKLLFRFHNTVNKQVTKEDIDNYIRQVDIITDRYLGRNRFISIWKVYNPKDKSKIISLIPVEV